MKDDTVMRLLRQVKSGKVSVEDARVALEDAALTEEAFEAAVNHGVFNEVKPGTIVRASLAPSGDSWLIIMVGLWGILWTLYWAGALAYGLYQHWDQQLLAFNLAMTLLTLIINGDCISKICTSGRDNCQAQEKQVHHKSRYKLLEKV